MARRKELKKSEFKELHNCIGNDAADRKGRWHLVFPTPQPLVLEIGCGTAELSYTLAQQNPDRNYVGIDLKPVRLWKPAKRALEESQQNILFLHIHLLHLCDFFAEGEVSEIWITFPDPFPKNKQAKHRMINPNFLALYRNILQKGGKMHFKTDNLDLFHYALEVFVREGNIKFHHLSFDLHQDAGISDTAKIQTEYEKKFRAEGLKINYVCFEFV